MVEESKTTIQSFTSLSDPYQCHENIIIMALVINLPIIIAGRFSDEALMK